MSKIQKMTDAELLDYCHRTPEDEPAWDKLLRRTYPYIRHCVRHLLSNYDDIADFTQLVAVKFFRALKKGRLPNDIKLYLNGIIRNSFCDYLEERGKRKDLFTTEDFLERPELGVDLVSDDASELRVVLVECVAQALVGFEPLEKEIIRLRLTGYEPSDIRTVLFPDRSYPAVKQQVYRLMTEFKGKLYEVIKKENKSSKTNRAEKGIVRDLYRRVQVHLAKKEILDSD